MVNLELAISARVVLWAIFALSILYLTRINQLLRHTPEELKRLSGSRWTAKQLKKTYERLEENPIDYKDKLPPKLNRRYVVTGGSGECRNGRNRRSLTPNADP